jgi:hypothetical protein
VGAPKRAPRIAGNLALATETQFDEAQFTKY